MVDLRSIVGFEVTVLGDLSIERREEFCKGEGESAASDLVTPLLLSLLTRGVAGDALLFGVSDKEDL